MKVAILSRNPSAYSTRRLREECLAEDEERKRKRREQIDLTPGKPG